MLEHAILTRPEPMYPFITMDTGNDISHAKDVVNFSFQTRPYYEQTPIHISQTYYMPLDIIIFPYGDETLDLRSGMNFLNTLNCYWIYVPVDKVEIQYVPAPFGAFSVPEPSLFPLAICFVIWAFFKRKRHVSK